MPLPLQSKLLRVLQEKEVERIGGVTPIKVDVRLICSTNQNLTQLIQDGRFRADLYYRINTIELAIPPLRDRLDDIPDLCIFLIQKFNRENGSYTQGVEQEVLALMRNTPGRAMSVNWNMSLNAVLFNLTVTSALPPVIF